MTEYLAGRAQMGTSLGFHIVFASLGVGFPLLLLVVEGLGLGTKDRSWRLLARRWSRAFGILFAVGAVSGTVLSFELGLLWPGFMGYAGGIIGLPFSMEGFAFFLEAIFLGLYLYGWERLSPLFHWLCTIPLALSGGASAWFVTTANAWMNSPTGFRLDNGRVTDVHPLQAIFNPGTPIETTHTMLSAYLATGFAVAAVYAAGILRGRHGGSTAAWAVAQAPYLVPPNITIEGSASPPEVMASLLITYCVGGAVLLPSLARLFHVFKGRNPAEA